MLGPKVEEGPGPKEEECLAVKEDDEQIGL